MSTTQQCPLFDLEPYRRHEPSRPLRPRRSSAVSPEVRAALERLRSTLREVPEAVKRDRERRYLALRRSLGRS